MDFVPQDRVPIATDEAPDSAELLRLIRAGHAGATRQLHRILTPGVRFLLRRRLDRYDVAREAQCVLEATIHTIETDVSVRPDGVPPTVRRLIQQQCTGHSRPATETGASDWTAGNHSSRHTRRHVPCRTRGSAEMLRLG